MQKRVVQFDKFQPCFAEMQANGTMFERQFALQALFIKLINNEINEPQKTIFGDPHFFYRYNYDADLRIWEIQALRLREKMLPGVLAADGTYELIQLEDGAHPAESTTMLYDEQRCFLYMQRNLHGVSIKALEILLQQLSGPNVSVKLKMQMKANSLARIVDTNAYRRVLLVADTEQLEAINRTPMLAETLNNASSFGGKVLKLELGFGRQRTGTLNSKKTAQLVKEAYGYTGIQKLAVCTAENEDTAFETIDLLQDRQGYKVAVNYSQQNPVTHEKLYYLCLKSYKEEMGIALDE